MNEKCQKEWEAHWQCLEMNNQELFACRKQERPLNKCVLEQLVRPASDAATLQVDSRLAGGQAADLREGAPGLLAAPEVELCY